MSTEFNRLKKPFTSARASVGGGHTELSLWVNHAKAGSITLRNEEVSDVLMALVRDDVAVHRSSAGVTIRDDVEPETTLVSEYGELTCLRDINEGSPQ